MTRPLTHFLRLAGNGKHRGCSGSELYSRKLAKAALDAIPMMDDSALAGFLDFVLLVRHRPYTAREVFAHPFAMPADLTIMPPNADTPPHERSSSGTD